MNKNRLWRVVMALGIGLLALGGAATARAEVTLPTNYVLYLSSPGNGQVDGVAYSDEDIMRYSPNLNPQWAKTFDGTDAGLPASADVDAYEYVYVASTFTQLHYMSFDEPVNVPGLGKVDDSDIVVYRANWLGNTWLMHFDGSTHGLTTAGEKLDAFVIASNEDIFLSTHGAFTVPVQSIVEQNGNDEDILGLIKGHSAFSYLFDGNEIGIAPGNDLNNYAMGLGHVFYNLAKPANFNGLNVDANDIIIRAGSSGAWEYARFFDGGANGFPKIDALDVQQP